MSYTKQTWINGETITDTKLNHMEDGIADAGGGGVMNVTTTDNGTAYVMNKTYNEIKTAFLSGTTIIVTLTQGDPEGSYSTDKSVVTGYGYGESDGVPTRGIFVSGGLSGQLSYYADSDDDYPYYLYD